MARPLRCEYLGAWFHVTARGNERREIFRDDRDRERFVTLLGELGRRYGLEVHAYVLMGNHYHLLLRMQEEKGLSAGMHFLGVSYSVWFNRRHRRVGHLFQGRFKAIVVDFEQWGVELSRYIHLNPVRTQRYGLGKRQRAAGRQGMGEAASKEVVGERLESLSKFNWSSYPAYCGRGKQPDWLHVGRVLEGFPRGARGKHAYRGYVEEAIRSGQEESPWTNVVGGFVLGGEELLDEIRERITGNPKEQSGLKAIRRAADIEEIVEMVSRAKGERWEDFGGKRGDWGRAMVLMLARRNEGISNRTLARWMGGKDDSTVSQTVRRLQERIKKDRKLAAVYKKLEMELSNVKM